MARPLIGSKLRERRKQLGLTQASLAERVGISASYLNLIESNRRNIGGSLLKRIADELRVPVASFDGAAERRVVDEVAEIALAPLFADLALPPASAADLAASHPGWAQALVVMHRAYLDRGEAVTALSDRLSQDPLLAEVIHNLLTGVSAIRSAAEILESDNGIEAKHRERFVSMIANDSRRLSVVAQAITGFLGEAQTHTRSVTPIEQVDDFFIGHGNHFPALEQAAEALRAEAGFTLGTHLPATAAAAPIAAEIEAAAALASPAARDRAAAALAAYVAGAVLMPYEAFLHAATELRHDIDALARRFNASYEQVCHRLATLRRPGSEGVRFGFLRADPAGHVQKRFPLPQLPLPRYGSACPLWPIYGAFQAPGSTVRQLAELPDGNRYFFIARAVDKARPAANMPRRLMSIMVMCDALHADRLVYADGLDLSSGAAYTPVGQTCRVCTRRECGYRQEDPIIDAQPSA